MLKFRYKVKCNMVDDFGKKESVSKEGLHPDIIKREIQSENSGKRMQNIEIENLTQQLKRWDSR